MPPSGWWIIFGPSITVGVLIFDNSFQWAVPLRKADDRAAIKRLISGITPDGGTQIAPALTEAFQRIVPVSAIYKHIVLLTDGISEEGDSMALTREAVANHVTISTVGLGQDVNRGFLEKVAHSAEGKSYFLNDPAGLEQIAPARRAGAHRQHRRGKAIHPKIAKHAEVLEGVGMDTAPALRGYVRFQARPSADTILEADKDDPCLCAGNTAWDAPPCSLPTPRTAGPSTGSPGPASTASGPMYSATCCRTRL